MTAIEMSVSPTGSDGSATGSTNQYTYGVLGTLFVHFSDEQPAGARVSVSLSAFDGKTVEIAQIDKSEAVDTEETVVRTLAVAGIDANGTDTSAGLFPYDGDVQVDVSSANAATDSVRVRLVALR